MSKSIEHHNKHAALHAWWRTKMMMVVVGLNVLTLLVQSSILVLYLQHGGI